MSRTPSPGTYIGLDIGTGGVRALAIDDDGNERARGEAPLPATRRAGGRSEADPEDWWAALRQALAALPQEVRAQTAALAVDATSTTLMLCDAAGSPLAPALCYDDARAVAQAERIAGIAPPDSAVHGPGSGLAKLLWLLEHTTDERATQALHQADWIAGRLSGRFGISDANNAIKLGYDARTGQWPDWLGALLPDTALLPRQVLAPGSVIGLIDPRVAESLDLPTHARIVAGTTDGVAATLATGIDRPGQAVTSLGTTLVLKVVTEAAVFDADCGVYSHRVGGYWLAGGASNTGGGVLARYFDAATLAALSARIDPDEESGLDYYPLTAPGERFPQADPAYAPRLEPRPVDDLRFLHGLLEGMARIEHAGYRRLAELGAPYPETVLSAGGGASNATWTRIRARVLGVPVRRAAHDQAAYGAALLARRGILRADFSEVSG
jgi:sugar (pentulose or hexulose) kinase